MIHVIGRQVVKHLVHVSHIVFLDQEIHRCLPLKVPNKRQMISRLQPFLFIAVEMTLFVDSLKYLSTVVKLVQYSLAPREDIVDQAFELLHVDLRYKEGTFLQLLNQVPMQEREALINNMLVKHFCPSTIISIIIVIISFKVVYCEHG